MNQFRSRGKIQECLTQLRNIIPFSIISYLQAESPSLYSSMLGVNTRIYEQENGEKNIRTRCFFWYLFFQIWYLNKEICQVNLRIPSKYGLNTVKRNSIFGYFSRAVIFMYLQSAHTREKIAYIVYFMQGKSINLLSESVGSLPLE